MKRTVATALSLAVVLIMSGLFPNIALSGTVDLSYSSGYYDCYIYDSAYIVRGYVKHIHSEQPFELSPANYVLSVNGSTQAVTVQPGANTFPLGTINLSWSTGYYDCYIYNSSGDIATGYLSNLHTDNVFGLFPGSYVLSVNGSTQKSKCSTRYKQFSSGKHISFMLKRLL